MANRYAQDIRRIVGFDDLKGGLAPAEVRDDIPGSRAVGYTNNDGSSSVLSGTPGETLAPVSTNSSVSDGLVNPSEDLITGEDDGNSTAEELLDGALSLGDELKEISAVDCASGLNMKIRTDGDLVPPEAIIAPDANGDPVTLEIAWTEANTPPDKEGYVLGSDWSLTSGQLIGQRFATAYSAISAAADDQQEGDASLISWTVSEVTTLDDDDFSAIVTFETTTVPTDQSYSGQSGACTPGSSASCPLSVPKVEEWPNGHQDNSFIHTFKDGVFISSEFDSLLPTANIAPLGEIDFCNDTDDRVGRMEPTQNGGFMISERASVGGVSISEYQVFDNVGRLEDFVGEATAALLRPNA